MKANLTRGNSITENHNPFATPQDCFDMFFAILKELRKKELEYLHKHKDGGVYYKNNTHEVTLLKRRESAISHDETLRIIRANV